jgi:hypothetical protein
MLRWCCNDLDTKTGYKKEKYCSTSKALKAELPIGSHKKIYTMRSQKKYYDYNREK